MYMAYHKLLFDLCTFAAYSRFNIVTCGSLLLNTKCMLQMFWLTLITSIRRLFHAGALYKKEPNFMLRLFKMLI